MGSKSKSESSTAQQWTDARTVTDASGGGIVGTGNTVNVIDGASSIAPLLLQGSTAIVKDLGGSVITMATKANDAAFKSSADALGILGDVIKRQTEVQSGNTVAMTALAAAAAMVFLSHGK